MGIKVDQNYALTLFMVLLVMAAIIAGSQLGVNPDSLPTGELIGGLLVLAGRLIKSD